VLAGKGPPFSFDTGRHAYLPWGRAALHASACLCVYSGYWQRASESAAQSSHCALELRDELGVHHLLGRRRAVARRQPQRDVPAQSVIRSAEQYKCALYWRVNATCYSERKRRSAYAGGSDIAVARWMKLATRQGWLAWMHTEPPAVIARQYSTTRSACVATPCLHAPLCA
jgi:hypothetical protein